MFNNERMVKDKAQNKQYKEDILGIIVLRIMVSISNILFLTMILDLV